MTNQTVTITASDEDGGQRTTSFVFTATVAVTNRQFFYNNSAFETSGGVAGALDSNKAWLASSTTAQTTTFANVSSYTRGINGAVLDVAGLASTSLSAADFIFRVAPSGVSGVVNPSTWANAPTPNVLSVAAGTSTTPARIQLEWADNQIQNTWLQIVVRANARTGLINPAVFYLGHAEAEVNGAAPYRTSVADLVLIQPAISANFVGISDPRDLDKDRLVSTTDLQFVQSRISAAVRLNNITVPAAGSTQEGSSGTGERSIGQRAPGILPLVSSAGLPSVSLIQPSVTTTARDSAIASLTASTAQAGTSASAAVLAMTNIPAVHHLLQAPRVWQSMATLKSSAINWRFENYGGIVQGLELIFWLTLAQRPPITQV